MKGAIVPLLLFLAACSSSGNKETSANDSTAVADTLANEVSLEEDDSGEENPEDEASEEEWTGNVEDEYAEWKNKINDMKDTLYYVSISTTQYEAGSDVTWYFNSNMDPVYFTMSWSAEGNEGGTEYFMEGGRVVCSFIEEYNTQEKWCELTGGSRVEFDDNTGEADSTNLDDVYGNNQTASLRNYLNTLSSIINEAELVDKDGESYTLKIEREVNYGFDFTETTNVTIARKVYEAYRD